MAPAICDTCKKPVDTGLFKCVVFTKHAGKHFVDDDITGYRCYPCDDKIVDSW